MFDDTAIGEDTEVAGGYLKNSVMLRKSRVGSNAHIRVGTLLEEEASTAHAVGLKHTVLMSFVTLGSLNKFLRWPNIRRTIPARTYGSG